MIEKNHFHFSQMIKENDEVFKVGNGGKKLLSLLKIARKFYVSPYLDMNMTIYQCILGLANVCHASHFSSFKLLLSITFRCDSAHPFSILHQILQSIIFRCGLIFQSLYPSLSHFGHMICNRITKKQSRYMNLPLSRYSFNESSSSVDH